LVSFTWQVKLARYQNIQYQKKHRLHYY
jgi:hypothetical protein